MPNALSHTQNSMSNISPIVPPMTSSWLYSPKPVSMKEFKHIADSNRSSYDVTINAALENSLNFFNENSIELPLTHHQIASLKAGVTTDEDNRFHHSENQTTKDDAGVPEFPIDASKNGSEGHM